MIETTTMKKQRKITNNQIIVNKFVFRREIVDFNFFPRELSMAKKLIENYGMEFLNWLELPFGHQLPSLCWFFTKKGQEHLESCCYGYRIEHPEYIFNNSSASYKKEIIELSSDKIDKDINIVESPKTLMDFLKKYK